MVEKDPSQVSDADLDAWISALDLKQFKTRYEEKKLKKFVAMRKQRHKLSFPKKNICDTSNVLGKPNDSPDDAPFPPNEIDGNRAEEGTSHIKRFRESDLSCDIERKIKKSKTKLTSDPFVGLSCAGLYWFYNPPD